MKKFLPLAAAAAALVSIPARAADLPAKAPPPAAAPVFNWTGFYVGGSGGYGWGHIDTSQSATGETTSEKPRGAFLGGQLGYNWQFSPNWVFGIEGDWSGANIEAIGNDPVVGVLQDSRYRVTSFGTARGRIGYAADRTLWYLTGGWGWADTKIEQNFPFFDSARKTQSGWVLGGGVEYAITGNWSTKLEYLHLDFGHDQFAFPSFVGLPSRVRTDLDIVRFGVNYRFGDSGKTPVASAIPTKAPGYRADSFGGWNGAYIGASAGYGWSKIDTDATLILTATSEKLHGYFLGGQLGYNWQFNSNWVIGIEGDWSAANLNTIGPDPDVGLTADTEYKVSSFGTVRGRIGYALDRTLWYGTGGWGWADTRIGINNPFFLSQHKTQSGWVAGGGVEYALNNNWSVKLEYLHLDLGRDTVVFSPTFPAFDVHVKNNIDLVRLGVNWKFGDPWGKAPVVAKY
jgi:outer membrane immunogenic protein